MKYIAPKLTAKQRKQQQAQDLVYDAFETRNPIETLDLIRKARVLDPENVDALCFMAAHSPDLSTMFRYYRQAVRVGEERLGEEFEKYRGHFWGITETRPYMRARAGLVKALLFDGQSGEAITQMWQMIALNKMDNQGMRYTLSTALLNANDFEGYERLLKLFPDDYLAAWQYNLALYLFLQKPNSNESVATLKIAFGCNRHVQAYLLGKKSLPKTQANSIILGEVSEAVEYAQNNKHLWENAPGALEWLKSKSGL